MMAKCTIVSFAVMDCSQHSVANVAIKSSVAIAITVSGHVTQFTFISNQQVQK